MPTNYTWKGLSSSAWATGGNWTPSGPPSTSGDSAFFDQTSVSNTGVAASDQSATTLAQLLIKASYTQTWGDNDTALKVNSAIVRIGDPSGASNGGTGATRINADFSTTATNIFVVSTAQQGVDANKEPVRIVATNVSNVATVVSGRVGFATNSNTDTGTFGQIGCQGSEAVVNIGPGMTLTTLYQSAGITNIYCGCTTISQDSGTINTYGLGTYTTINCNGNINSNSTGTITTLKIQPTGNFDLTSSVSPRTITTIQMYTGSTLSYDPAVVTITNPIQCIGCSPSEVTINTPPNRTVAIT